MVRLVIEDQRTNNNPPLSIPSEDYTHNQFVGRKWLDCVISEWKKSDKEIRISCEWVDGPGTIGIWSPLADDISNERVGPRIHDYFPSDEVTAHAECKSWEFGNKASIIFHRSKHVEEDLEVRFSILCRPIFTQRDPNCELQITVHSREQGVDKGELMHHKIQFEKTEADLRKSIWLMQEEYNRFKFYQSYHTEGKGNIVHPKQALTIKGLKHIIDNFTKKKKVSITYIGTDTTENLCSLVRWLNDSGMMEKIDSINVLFEHDWDSEFLDYLEDEHPLKNHDKVSYSELDDETIERQVEQDIVILTYVTPWISLGNRDFSKLLLKLMGNNSYLLSVDPLTQDNSIRSLLKNSRTNNQDLYRLILNFINMKKITEDSIEYIIWKRKPQENSSSQGGE